MPEVMRQHRTGSVPQDTNLKHLTRRYVVLHGHHVQTEELKGPDGQPVLDANGKPVEQDVFYRQGEEFESCYDYLALNPPPASRMSPKFGLAGQTYGGGIGRTIESMTDDQIRAYLASRGTATTHDVPHGTPDNPVARSGAIAPAPADFPNAGPTEGFNVGAMPSRDRPAPPPLDTPQDDLDFLTLDELKAKCKEDGINAKGAKDKADYVARIREHERE